MILNFKKILIFVLLSLCLFAFASSVFAEDESLWNKIKPPGEMPGMVSPPPGEETPGFLIVQVVTWIMGFVGAIAIGFIVYGGIKYVTSAGNEKQIEEAKKIILYAIIGFVIAILAVVIVQVVGRAVGGSLSL